ncbi:MAG: aspartate--tRNA(Asn) ligase [Candidatus Levybacteria bacterium RBG_16_35_11]|nr:MAG: aspartate--tRNA(Asn) ligase [Candidatus Levybacteria bacterium RBG_16_35_11]
MAYARARTLTIEAIEASGKKITVYGWVRLRRDHGKLIFLDIRDRTGIIQAVVNPKVSQEAYKTAQTLRAEDVVEIAGKVNKRPESAVKAELETGTIELEASSIEIISKAETLPFDMGANELNLELPTLLDYRSIALRHPKIAAIFKIQETITGSFRNTLKKEGFTEIFVPTIVPSATEGGAEVFPLDYYDKKAYLAQSPQLYKQIMVSIYERVFTIAHAYRAEPSITTRHLSEYLSLDVEFGFIDNFEELMDMAEKIVVNLLKDVEEKNKKELSLFGANIPKIKSKIPKMKMREAQDLVFKMTGVDHRSEPDLDPSDEKELCKWANEKYGAPFVFVTHYPTSKRPFYTMPDSSNPEYTLSFDMLGFTEEWITGGQRINDYNMLVENMKKRKINPSLFEIYLQAFKYGMPPEGGFAMGLERITKDLLGLLNIREASLFPRDMERVDERLSKSEK